MQTSDGRALRGAVAGRRAMRGSPDDTVGGFDISLARECFRWRAAGPRDWPAARSISMRWLTRRRREVERAAPEDALWTNGRGAGAKS
jgi:hypothetical protein